MVSHERLEEFERFIKAQRKLPFAERVRILRLKKVLDVLAMDEAQLRQGAQALGTYPELVHFALLMLKVRANAARVQAGPFVSPFHGCESRPAFSTLAVTVGCEFAWGVRDVLDVQDARERQFYAALEPMWKNFDAWAQAFRRRRRGIGWSEVGALLETYDRRRAELRSLFAAAENH